MRTVHLIGVNHKVQAVRHGSEADSLHEEYAACLETVCKRIGATAIAEEYSESALGKDSSVTLQVANELKASHYFCDPCKEERKALRYFDRQTLELNMFLHDGATENLSDFAGAIEIGRYFPIREEIWLDKIKNLKEEKLVFVCGDVHVESFKARLEGSGFEVQVASRGLGCNEEEINRYSRARQYLFEHPELSKWEPPEWM